MNSIQSQHKILALYLQGIVLDVTTILSGHSIYLMFLNLIIIIRSMTTSESKQMAQIQNKFLNQQILFKRSTKHRKYQLFEGQHNNLQLTHNGEQQNVFCFNATPARSSDKPKLHLYQPHTTRQAKWDRIQLRNNDTFLKDSVSKQKIKRAFSSKRFDLLTTKQARKKTKKMMPHIFDYITKKESTSKKSTDESSSTPIENLKAENREFLQKIRQQELRMKRIQQAIQEQKKLHELQKHMYNQNIEKLKKLAGILSINNSQQELSMIEDEGLDRLSIQSN